ncbi:MAG: Hsp20 family protein [Chromatiales bacterium]|jgi:hypothetical protein
MKIVNAIVVATLLLGLVSPIYAQPPEAYGNPMFQPPLPPSSMQYRSYGRIWVEKGMDQDGYKLQIYTSNDIDPASIQVRIVGHTIIIESKQSYQQEERSDRGFYSYSRSSSNFRRRFSIPRDADIENMKRTENNGVITITLPFLYTNPEHQ